MRMKLKECYESIGANYEEVVSRLMSDDRVKKYLERFADSNDLDKIVRCVEAKNFEDGYRNAHTLKGLCLNLGITRLQAVCEVLCEAIKDGNPTVDLDPILQNLKDEYKLTMDAISKL